MDKKYERLIYSSRVTLRRSKLSQKLLKIGLTAIFSLGLMLYLHLAPSKRFSYGSQRLRFWREDNLDLDQDQLNFLGKASQLFFYSRRKQKVVKEIKKRKFLVRDWSIWLGWNNQRYIIESALLLAKKLDRELVLPAFHYANSCEEDKLSDCIISFRILSAILFFLLPFIGGGGGVY
ncbi:hypothetical protein BY996DRAFT_89589 [Phakopsora pachyrhizi]|nr:hypothetical protein BY996DRAFT_89589 [Phakopsora pachyrhizi]